MILLCPVCPSHQLSRCFFFRFHCCYPTLGPYFHMRTSSVSSLTAVLQGHHQTNFPKKSSYFVLTHQKQLENWTSIGDNFNCFQALGNKQHKTVILKRREIHSSPSFLLGSTLLTCCRKLHTILPSVTLHRYMKE